MLIASSSGEPSSQTREVQPAFRLGSCQAVTHGSDRQAGSLADIGSGGSGSPGVELLSTIPDGPQEAGWGQRYWDEGARLAGGAVSLYPLIAALEYTACEALEPGHGPTAATDEASPRAAPSQKVLNVLECVAALSGGYADGCGRRMAEMEAELRRRQREILDLLEEERRRIARELHDESGQALTAAIFRLDLCASNLPMERNEVISELRQIRTSLFDCSRNLHRLAFNLRPPLLQDLGLVPTLQWYVEHCGQQYNIAIKLDVTPEEITLNPNVETAVFRIVQEALTNVAKHSGATAAQVRLELRDGILNFAVLDNGRGFDPDATTRCGISARPSLGIAGMRERVRLLDGELVITSEPGRGSAVIVRVPIRDNPH